MLLDKLRNRQKLKYFTTCLKKQLLGQGFKCPSCGSSKSKEVSRKFVVTTLRRCEDCQLLFRAPTTSEQEMKDFYQEDYTEGFTTDCPDDASLDQLLKSGFKNHEKDYRTFIRIVEAAGGRQDSKLFDFGCSWGYGSWQFKQAGFDVESFEISNPRANYARSKLDLRVHTELPATSENFDFFFSSHVIEHVPSVKRTIEFGLSNLKPGGQFIAVSPNGSLSCRDKIPHWEQHWGLAHPQCLDENFYQKIFANHRYYISSSPFDFEEIAAWQAGKTDDKIIKQDCGHELLVVVTK